MRDPLLNRNRKGKLSYRVRWGHDRTRYCTHPKRKQRQLVAYENFNIKPAAGDADAKAYLKRKEIEHAALKKALGF